jgi:hypothetical protein
LEERFPDEPTSKKFGDLRHFCKCDLELYKQLLKIQDQNKSFKDIAQPKKRGV